MERNILVVDDEVEIADLVELYLKYEGYAVYKAYSGKEALNFVENEKIDLAILDLMLPDMSGFEICKIIREKHNYSIIMLTAKDEEFDKINGLMLGADDYMVKPFLPLELVARVKAQLRRYFVFSNEKFSNRILMKAGLELNLDTRECILNDQQLYLTPTEFDILRILMENKGNVMSSEELFKMIWKDEYYTKNNNTITVHIRHIREKMGDSAEFPQYIKTVWGVGYKIEEVGKGRIFFAAVVSAITKFFGITGMFYRIAGSKVRGIDSPDKGGLPPYNEFISLTPENPDEYAKAMSKIIGEKVVIVDANDIGVNILGVSDEEMDRELCAEIFRKNPLGQKREQTPMGIVRKV